jgi:hypothetical protein
MKSADLRNKSTAAVGIGGRLGVLASVAVLAASVAAFTPTAASAFDIEGLIGTAIALGALQGGPYHHGRSHVVSRHDSGGSSSGVERDARDVDVPPLRAESKIAARRQALAHSGVTTQASERDASERDASAGEPALSGRSSDDAPAYRPSR